MGKSLIWHQATPTVYIQLTTGAMNIVIVPPGNESCLHHQGIRYLGNHYP